MENIKDFEVYYKPQFKKEFENFPKKQQDKILDFTDIFEEYGLSDFTRYEGKISPSWAGVNISEEDYNYTYNNHLWHYHIGLPDYKQKHGKYKTSDIVLHFQWEGRGNIINLIDLYNHYKLDGSFYLPPKNYLDG
ncbi:hypothetical protein M2H13_22855 [Vibrio vulnificus]|nr:hypothetical protein [Vibrio vulnificus]